MSQKRRLSDALRAVDGLLDTHLQQGPVAPRALMNLAIAMLTEYTAARRGSLLLRDDGGLRASVALSSAAGELRTPDAGEPTHSQELVDAARQSQAPARGSGQLATPILVGGRVEGVIYLEAWSGHPDDAVVSLSAEVARRIATLLHSSRLVEQAARQTQKLELLEDLGAFLTARRLSDEEYERTLEVALCVTSSEQALVGVFGEAGALTRLQVLGGDEHELSRLGRALVTPLTQGRGDEAQTLLGEPAMLQPLGNALTPRWGVRPTLPLGFLAVRRSIAEPYRADDVRVFGALSHILGGALAGQTYYKQAAEDSVTGVGSRLAMELAMYEMLAASRRNDRPLSLLLLDVDHFKQVNDTHGHQVGDAVLKAVSERISSRLRTDDFVGRYGGDEFLVLLPDTPVEAAHELAQQLVRMVAAEPLGETGLKVTLSVGVATHPRHGETALELLAAADQGLYKVKQAGRNGVSLPD